MAKKYIGVIGFLIVFSIAVAIAYSIINKPKKLKIYNPAELNPAVVDSSLQHINKNHRIGKFSLINQYGEIITETSTEGKIYIADFFFTTCPTLCPKMAKQMIRVQEKYKNNPDVIILSHSVMPENDSVPALLEYAKKQDAIKNKWHLLTGPRSLIYELARKHYFTATTSGSGGLNDLIHTENFVLIDPDKRIRGFYDGTSQKEVDILLSDIDALLNEYK